jgi:hypothetical protein
MANDAEFEALLDQVENGSTFDALRAATQLKNLSRRRRRSIDEAPTSLGKLIVRTGKLLYEKNAAPVEETPIEVPTQPDRSSRQSLDALGEEIETPKQRRKEMSLSLDKELSRRLKSTDDLLRDAVETTAEAFRKNAAVDLEEVIRRVQERARSLK